jgi:hypothetical protein
MGAIESKWSPLRKLETRIVEEVGNRSIVRKERF